MGAVVQRMPVQRYQDMLSDNGFEAVDYRDKKIYWRQIGPAGQHVVIETIGGTSLMIPDWKTKFMLITVYKGPWLCETPTHQETAYILDDFLEFIKELNQGKFR